jgi:Plasmid encoded RepA protein
MGTVHDLIEARGRDAALRAEISRRVVDAAMRYMGDEDGDVGFVYSGWAQAALPHRRLPDDATWQVQTEKVTLLVEPGRRITDGKPVLVGVPYGSRARLIMLYLQTESLRTGSREVELGRSLRAWLGRMGIPHGGKSIKEVREQAERISRCRLTFHVQQGGRAGLLNQHIVDTALFLDRDDPSQGSLFLETARLSEMFWEQLQRHPVPIEEAAIRAINNNSMALDIYCWLAYRLHVLTEPRAIGWKALHAQFGGGFLRLDHFRPRFLENLQLALAVYRDARVSAGPKGLTLEPSRPPVPPRAPAIALSR